MRTKWFLFVGLILFSFKSQACDLCSMYLTINPNDYKHSLQLNYRYRSAEALIKQGFLSAQAHVAEGYYPYDTYVKEQFQTIDLWGKFYLTQKLQLMVNLPYHINEYSENDTITQSTQGIGDISALALYQVYNSMYDANNNFRQRFNVGGGIKLPTGSYKEFIDDEFIDEDYQLGTGSIDFMINAQYLAKYKRVGLSTNLLYKINGENNMGYAFSNGLSADIKLFYQQPIGSKTVFMPEVGIYHEQAERDIQNRTTVPNTGGKVSYINTGVRLFYNNLALAANYFVPVSEALNDFQLANNDRFIVSLTWSFSSKFAE
tara:strand:- start:1272 stop:2222 length:951 start_codon:yes stop_codon:yes gene_type:complete